MSQGKRMAKVLSVLVISLMVFASVAVLSAGASAAPTGTAPAASASAGHPMPASGSISLSVTTLARDNVTNGTTTSSTANGGSFGSGATLYVCFSETQTFNAATAVPFGQFTLPAGATTLSNAVLSLGIATEFASGFPQTAPSGGYIAITDNYLGCGASGATYTTAVAVSIPVSASPTFQVSPATNPAGSTASVVGTGWDASATVVLALVSGSSSSLPVAYTTNSHGNLPASATLSIPMDLAAGTYALVATETAPAAGALIGITVGTAMVITPYVAVSPSAINGNAGNTLTVSGYGFPSGASIVKDWITVNTEAILGYTTMESSGTTHVAVTIGTNGQFTVTVALNSTISGGGGGLGDVNVYYGAHTLFTQSAAFFVSNPNPAELKLIFQDLVTSDVFGLAGDAFSAQVWNWYPAGSTVTIYMGAAVVGTITTDSFGFGTLTATVPELGGGTYVVRAVSSPYAALGPSASTFTIESQFQAVDPTGAPLAGEYLPSTGLITIEGFGLSTGTEYTALDWQVQYCFGMDVVSAGAAGDLYPFTISVGTLAPDQAGILPASNGTVVFTYAPSYGDSSNGTSSDSGVYFGPSPSGAGIDAISTGAAYGYNYSSVDPLYQGLDLYPFVQVLGQPLFVNETDLIPSGASSFYPGVTNVYNFFWGSTELANATGVTDFTALNGNLGFAFPNPVPLELVTTTGMADGLQTVAISYGGQGASAALDSGTMLGSAPGSSINSGVLHYVGGNDPGSGDGYGFLAYDLPHSSGTFPINVYVYYSDSTSGVINVTAYGCVRPANGGGSTHVVPANGAIKAFLGGCTTGIPLNLNPAGTYIIWVALENATTGATGTVSIPFTIVPDAIAFTDTSNAACPDNYYVGTYCATTSGGTILMLVNGLDVYSSYDIYFGNTLVSTNVTNSMGETGWLWYWDSHPFVSDPAWVFNAPLGLVAGTYTVSVVPSGMPLSAAVATSPIVITGSPTITLFTGGADQSFAFPGELLAYNWTPASAPTPGIPVTVTILLNGTPYTTEVAQLNPDNSITGSFAMPNSCSGVATSCAGTYWWVTLGWSQQYVSGGSSSFATYTEPAVNAAFLQLVVGNGALLTGVSAEQIAEITTAVNQTLEVPIAELNAAVVSINNATVQILTAFGTMTSTLAAINATVQTTAAGVADVQNGIVQIQTSLGLMSVSLMNLGSQITALNGPLGAINTTVNGLAIDMVTVQMSLGTITTTLQGLGAQITDLSQQVSGVSAAVNVTQGDVVLIQTTLGTIGGQVTSVQNGIVTIETALGNITTTVNTISGNTNPGGGVAGQNSLNTVTYLTYALIALAVIILILVILLILMAGRMRPPKTGSPTAYEGPSSSTNKGTSGGGSSGGGSA